MKTQPEEYMRQTILLAEENLLSLHGGPFASLIIKDGVVLATAKNSVNKDNDPTAHAEINAIRMACSKIGNASLEGAILYTNAEPCPMCLSAIYWANIKKVYYGASKEQTAAAGFSDAFIYEELSKAILERNLIFSHLLPEESGKIFEDYKALADDKKNKIKNGSF